MTRLESQQLDRLRYQPALKSVWRDGEGYEWVITHGPTEHHAGYTARALHNPNWRFWDHQLPKSWVPVEMTGKQTRP